MSYKKWPKNSPEKSIVRHCAQLYIGIRYSAGFVTAFPPPIIEVTLASITTIIAGVTNCVASFTLLANVERTDMIIVNIITVTRIMPSIPTNVDAP